MTGHEIVDAISQMHFSGNVTPASWFRHITIKRRAGKKQQDATTPDLIGIILLSDIVFWYRWVEDRDEQTGKFLGHHRRFRGDMLQRSNQSFADTYGLSVPQVHGALSRLQEFGVIRLHIRNVRLKNGRILPHQLFIEPVPAKIQEITYSVYGPSLSVDNKEPSLCTDNEAQSLLSTRKESLPSLSVDNESVEPHCLQTTSVHCLQTIKEPHCLQTIPLPQSKERKETEEPTETKKEPTEEKDTPPPPEGGDEQEVSPVRPQKPKKPRQPKELPSYDPDGYRQFMAAYPCRRNLDQALKAWDYLRPDAELQQTMLTDIAARKANDKKWADGFIVYPGRYLKDRRWRDEITPGGRVGPSQAADYEQMSEAERQAYINSLPPNSGERARLTREGVL